MKRVVAIIPARLQSTRLPMKLLKQINGKSIIQMTYEAVMNSSLFDDVIVACDDESLVHEIASINGHTFLSTKLHESGSDRIAEVASGIEADIIVNVQGDEPFIQKNALEKIIALFNNPAVEVASLMTTIKDEAQWKNPNCVKVVVDKEKRALYFSRAPIPYRREQQGLSHAYRHIGLYAFTKKALLSFTAFPPSELEQIEKLENLRILENGMDIYLDIIDHTGISIDTEEDYAAAIAFYNKQNY